MGDTGTTAFLHQDRTEPTLSQARGWRRLLAREEHEADLGRRRFVLRHGPAGTIIEDAEKSYLFGFNAVVSQELGKIEELPPRQRAFGYEGAGAACTALDLLTLTRGRRLHELLAGPAAQHQYAVHLGAGRGYALLRLRPVRRAKRSHPLLRWLAVDGYGFQRSLDHTDRMVGERALPDLPTRAFRGTFDQGLGRLLWYHDCASPDDVAARVSAYPAGRRADLWSGVAFAATRVGGAGPADLERLAEHAGADGFRAHLAQGCAFAAAAGLWAGPPPEHVEQAVRALTGAESGEVASWVDDALTALGHDPHTHDDFLAWQAGTRRAWAGRHG
ncbi:hypothetical protein GCM10012289_14740 [Nonomuraea cavernae]|uniref:DUF1702 family protein n=1 Tax=Nonomuraea cavernae TaxID=2045107 RepID=A0A917YUL1_9ACTN|nr:hypothetical protein GCM10012289_14740 [Nonomuraea cavernae]